MLEKNEVTGQIIGKSIEVHRILGPGLLESAYQECLYHELKSAGLNVAREVPLPIVYKNLKLDHGYRVDLLVENLVVVELKTVEFLTDIHMAQVLTYMRFGSFPIGLLINFNVKLLKEGLRRFVF